MVSAQPFFAFLPLSKSSFNAILTSNCFVKIFSMKFISIQFDRYSFFDIFDLAGFLCCIASDVKLYFACLKFVLNLSIRDICFSFSMIFA